MKKIIAAIALLPMVCAATVDHLATTYQPLFCPQEGFRIVAVHFSLGSQTGTTNIPWADVTRLIAYKRDLLAVDLICLAVFFDDKGTEMYRELHEEMVGFKALIDALPHRFPIRDQDWCSKVAFPAFATNMTTLWEKEPQPRPTVPSPVQDTGDVG